MPMTGADLASLQAIRQVAATTGELAVTTASETRRATETARGEVDDVVRSMSEQFTGTLDRLERVADDADRQVTTSGWQGAARENAVRAAADFRTGVVTLGTQSRGALTDFDGALDRRVSALNDDISGRFTGLMTSAQQSFEAYARAVQSYGSDLESADQSVTYR